MADSTDPREEEPHKVDSYKELVPSSTPLFQRFTKSSWMLLISVVIVAALLKKAHFETFDDGAASEKNLLLSDTTRVYTHFYALTFFIGIWLGGLADWVTGKKVIMMATLCLTIMFYFYVAMVGMWPSHRRSEVLNVDWRIILFGQMMLYAILGIEAVAVFESLHTTDFKSLYAAGCVKYILEVSCHLVLIGIIELIPPTVAYRDSIINFTCLLLALIVFFIWLLFVGELSASSEGACCKLMWYNMKTIGWKMRLKSSTPSASWTDHGQFSGDDGKAKDQRENVILCKQLLYSLLMIMPAFTSSYPSQISFFVFRDAFRRLKTSLWKREIVNLFDLANSVFIFLSIPLIEFILMPVLKKVIRTKNHLLIRLFAAMMTGLVAFFFGFHVVTLVEDELPHLPEGWTSELRFVNALNFSVHVTPIDKAFVSHEILPRSAHQMSYIRQSIFHPSKSLLDVELRSTHETFSYVTAVSLEQEKCVTYFISDYMEIKRVEGTDPIFTGPPGTNSPFKSRVYFANLDPELSIELVLTFHNSDQFYSEDETPELTRKEVDSGKKTVFQIIPGSYAISFSHSNAMKMHTFGPGGVYGIIYAPEVKAGTSKFMIFTILPPLSIPVTYGLVYQFLVCLSLCFIFVAFEVFVFLKSPRDFRCIYQSTFMFFIFAFIPEASNYVMGTVVDNHIDNYMIIMFGSVYIGLCIVSGFIVVKFKKHFRIPMK